MLLMRVGCLVFGLLFVASRTEFAATERSAVQRAAFLRANPCPVTGQPRGKCPGWVVDHIVPLCAGGADHPQNMQWQTVTDSRAKDRDERRQCAALRKPDPAASLNDAAYTSGDRF
ncbi:MAG: hypothetical protein AW12_00833 [Candidatus Accumulibacter sp. BA-94]|uniref:HNH endonuclease signature motif containing protein n=1 Tax=Accumulibacter sp. TaxID=2053492 RepID=UPI00044C4DC7|nr:HNH endonuclease signature motif containing protein [Accumulibacter sp.]EXI92090.1 MAG: hypothetical protein AW12_00833 [Candidatus Accumulibacter sp. BA-94]HRD86779.1 HNH endonuclease signature motif containing protein [Accumulibacter sp.]